MRFLLLLLCGLALTPGTAPGAVLPDDPAGGAAAVAVPDEDVPYGVAASWLLGHQLLAEGRTSDALPLLHQAYRAQPDALAIALDFQAALAVEGYVRDALTVMDKLVMDHPDSTSFRLRRSALLARTGNDSGAMADLKELRAQGDDSLALLFAEASLLDGTGKSDRALSVLRGGLERFPESAGNLYLEMAGILQRGGRTNELIDVTEAGIAAAPDRPALWLVRLRALASAGLDADAAAAAQEADRRFGTAAAARDSENGDADDDGDEGGLPPGSFVIELADHYARQQQLDKAILLLQPMSERGELELNPSLWLGRMLLGTGRETEGAALVDRVLGRWPEAPRAWFLKGKVSEGADDWGSALRQYRRAVELGPDDGEVRLSCIRALLVTRGKLEAGPPPAELSAELRTELTGHCQAAAALVPEKDTAGRMILGYGFRAADDLMRAAENFAMAALDESLKLNALIQKSLCHDELGEDVAAREDLERLRKDFPDNAEVANTLGYYLAEKAVDLERAEKMIRQALATDPGNGAYLDSLGWVLYRQGRFEGALDYLIQAVNVLPEDPVILEHLGMVLRASGKDAEALDVLRRSLAFGGDGARVGAVIREIEAKGTAKR